MTDPHPPGAPSWPPVPPPVPPPSPADQQYYGQYHGDPSAQPFAARAAPVRRPGTVTAAAVIAIGLSGLTLLASAVFCLVALARSDSFLNGFRNGSHGQFDSWSDTEIVHLLLGIFGVLGLWSLTAVLLGVFVLRRSNVARVLLTISAVVTIVVSLIGILSVLAIFTMLGAIATIVLLFVGGANRWFEGPAGVRP